MHLKTGSIVWFRYHKYREDKTPIALILFDHDRNNNVHAINLNYLPNDLTQQVINMIALIASKELDAKDMKQLYHYYMKKRLHPIIRRAYRTYKKTEITHPKLVSTGFNEMLTFLHKFKTKFTEYDKRKIHYTVDRKLRSAQYVKNILMNKTIMTPAEAEKRAREYISKIQKFKPKEINWKKYTGA